MDGVSDRDVMIFGHNSGLEIGHYDEDDDVTSTSFENSLVIDSNWNISYH